MATSSCLHIILGIARRECRILFTSPLGYSILFCFTVLLWYMYQGAVVRLSNMPRMSPYSIVPLAAFFETDTVCIVILLIIPAITMRLMPEEKSHGTYELLLVCPIEEWQIVIGKFLGVWCYFLALWILSTFQVVLIACIGEIDWGQVIAVYLFLFICTGGLSALGLCVSCLLRSQLACFLVTFTLLLPFAGRVFLGHSSQLTSFFYLETHLEKACRGTLDSFGIFLFLSVAVVALFTATQIISARKWFPMTLEKPRLSVIGLFCAWLTVTLAIWLLREPLRGMSFNICLIWVLLTAIFARFMLICWQSKKSRAVWGANVVLSLVSLGILAVAGNYLAYRYQIRWDQSSSRGFTIDSGAVSLLQRELPDGERIRIIALFGFSEKPEHEHLERDNERYCILQEVLRKMADSLNRPGKERICYQFVPPTHHQAQSWQAEYGGAYRDVLLLYRDRCYIITDAQLFLARLERSHVPRLLILWRKIYEAGRFPEPPPDPADEEKMYEKIKEKANHEMLAIYPVVNIEEVLINAIVRLIRGIPRRVYFTQELGEKLISGNIVNDYSTAYLLAEKLRRHNFQLRTLRINEVGHIPPDCDLLVVLGPSEPFSNKSLQLLRDYLQANGRLVILLSAASDAALDILLQQYGIHTEAVVATWFSGPTSKLQRVHFVEIPTKCIHYRPMEEIIARWNKEEGDSFPVFYMDRVRIVEAMPQLPASIEVHNVLYIENPKVFASPLNENEAGREVRHPPYSIGAFATSSMPDGWKLVVIGNADFTGDAPCPYDYRFVPQPNLSPFIMMGCNRFLLPALLELLSHPWPTIPVIATKPTIFEILSFPDSLKRRYFWTNGILCGMIAAIGIFLWRRDVLKP